MTNLELFKYGSDAYRLKNELLHSQMGNKLLNAIWFKDSDRIGPNSRWAQIWAEVIWLADQFLVGAENED